MRGLPRASIAELTAAGAATAMLALWLPLASDDPFRLTLTILPLVVGALRAVDRRARQLGACDLRPAAGRVEGVLLVVLALAAVGRHRLGLVASDWFLASGFVLLAAHHVARRLVAWRPCLGRRLARRPPAIFFLLPLIVYLAIQPWSAGHRQPDGDEPFYLLLSHSLAYDFDADLTNNYAAEDWRRFMERPIKPQPGDPVGSDGERLSRHNLLLPLALAPAYRLAGRWGAMAVMAGFTALLAWMVLRLGYHYSPHRPGAVLLAYAIFAFTPPLLLYSYQIWIEVPAALLLTVALDRILALRRERRWGRWRAAGLLLPLVLLPLLKLRLGLLAIPLLFLAWQRARPTRRTMALIAGGLVLSLGGLLAYNALRYGNPLKMHSWNELGLFEHALSDFVRGGVGMLYDSAFGLFPCAPLWALLLPALWVACRRRCPLIFDCAVVALPYLLALWPRIEWYGGWAPPFRYPLVLLPLLALLLAPLFEQRSRPGLRWTIAVLGGVTLVLTVIWVVIPGWTYNFADGRTHLLDQAGVRLGGDVARFFPSTVRSRPATWIWPLASLLLIPLALRRGGRRRLTATGAAAIGAAAATLLAAGVLLTGVVHWPTRIVELEDDFVSKQGGNPSPPLWTIRRPLYRSGWAMTAGSRLTAPVVSGGERATLRLTAQQIDLARGGSTPDGEGPLRSVLQVTVGDRLLAVWQLDPRGWQKTVIGPVEWPADAPLVISRPDAAGDGAARADEVRVIVDRAELEWQ